MKKIFILFFVACFSATLFAQTEVPRHTLIEVFTSSTCAPCYSGNITLKNVLAQNDAAKGKYTLIKYQMNWPGTGDPYYTAEGNTRRGVYGLNVVPYLLMDASYKQSYTNSTLLAAQAVPSYVTVSGTYYVAGQTVGATINIEPTMDISGGNNLRLYVAIVEKRTVNNKKTNGESEFFQVMKKFMPNANGIILGDLNANELITHELTWEFKGNYRLPANANSPINHNTEHSVEDFANLEVVAWVQNSSTKQIYNSGTAEKVELIIFNTNNENGTITATANGVPINSGGMLKSGDILEFTAEPNQKNYTYYIKEWKHNGVTVPGNTSNTYSFVFETSAIVTAVFTRDYNVNFDVINGNGTLSASTGGNSVNPGDDIEENSTVVFTATPNEGYKVKEWKLNGTVVAGNVSNNFSHVLNNDAVVTVEFRAPSITFNVINGNGVLTATADGDPVTPGAEIAPGTVIEFTAIPDENYIVKEWKHNGVVVADNTTNNFSITLATNTTVTVEFKEFLGIKMNNLSEVELFPNPITNKLIINNTEQIQKVLISNTLGQIVKEEILTGKNTVVISTQNLQPGIFFVTLQGFDGNEVTKKIVKQ